MILSSMILRFSFYDQLYILRLIESHYYPFILAVLYHAFYSTIDNLTIRTLNLGSQVARYTSNHECDTLHWYIYLSIPFSDHPWSGLTNTAR